jgi:hypothetical protein
MAHVQKPDFVFWRNGQVHLNWQERQFSRLLAAEVRISAAVMLDTPCSEAVWRVLATHSIRQFPPSLPLPCVTVCHHVSTGFYNFFFFFFFNGATARFGHWSLQTIRLQIYLSSVSLLRPLRFSSNKESLLMSSHLSRVIPTRFLPLNFPFSSMYIRRWKFHVWGGF